MHSPPHFVVINLNRDTMRLAHMRNQFDRIGLSFERFAAINGTDVPDALRGYFEQRVEDRSPLSAGEIGCYASHLEICRRIVDGSLPAPLCALEDDVEIPSDFAITLKLLLERLPTDWDIVRLSNDTKRAVMPISRLRGPFKLVRYTNVPGSTGASLISRSGAQKFLKTGVRTRPVDQDLRRVWAWDLETFGVIPAPVRRDVLGVSTIDAMAAVGWREESWRIARLRRRRVLEAPLRHLHGMRTFGPHRWLAAELINVAAAIAPRKRRAQTLTHLSALLGPS
ncbi:MAG: glycosyltransferase family 25 protein [Hyphomonadaceae bacterium]